MSVMSTSEVNERKQKRIQWWKEHGKQINDESAADDSSKPKERKALKSLARKSFSKKEVLEKSNTSQATLEGEKKIQTDADKKKRYVAFVGNLPFNLKKEDVMEHFKCTGGAIDFRLMTKKETGASKGCGFLEFEDSSTFTKALNLHHSALGGRKINVEVTCGGGGLGEKRTIKLREKKKKFKQKRARKRKMSDTDSTKTSKEITQNSKNADVNETREPTDSEEKRNKRKRQPVEDEPVEGRKRKTKLEDAGAMVSLVEELQLEKLVKQRKREAMPPGKTDIQEQTNEHKKHKKRNKKSRDSET